MNAWWRRWQVLAPVTAIVIALLVVGVLSIGFEEPDLADPGGGAPVEAVATPLAVEPVTLEELPEHGSGETITMTDEQQTATGGEPCQTADADAPEKLVVKPNPLHLLGTKGTLVIHNCGSKSVSWTAQTKPWVTLADAAGVLAAKTSHDLKLTVNTASLPTGAYTFKVKISQPGYNTYVDVTGTKLGGLVNPSPASTIGGFTTGGPTGCAAKCITKAWLTAMPGTANVSLEVKTNLLAKMGAQVSTAAPKIGPGGKPYFTAPEANIASGDYRMQWNAVLKPLKANTSYHIIVAAMDLKGGVSYQSGTFKTAKVATGLAAAEPGGCSANCVKQAQLKPQTGKAKADITVQTYVPAKMAVYANGGAPLATSGQQFRTEWAATLELEYAKEYEIRLEVTDEQGHVQVHTASISTPEEPVANHQNNVLVTFHKIHVSDDADDTVFNRKGELRFRFEVNGQRQVQLDTGEHKVRSPETLSLDNGDRGEGRRVLVNNAPDLLSIRVQGLERDNNQPGFCAAGQGMFDETSGRELIEGCYEMEWNTASALIDLHAPSGGGALPPCYGFGVTGDICVAIAATGDDPRFEVYVTIDFVD